jgi:membrane fusion protein, multidrug efflux system
VVDKEHKVQYRKVDTGALFHGLRVIDSGLGANDVVVVNGLQRVRPGVEVNPQKVAMSYRLGNADKALVERGDAPVTDSRTAQTGTTTASGRPQG